MVTAFLGIYKNLLDGLGQKEWHKKCDTLSIGRTQDIKFCRTNHWHTKTINQPIVKLTKGLVLDTTMYGRKESEGRDYNEDTNFGKLKRIPYGSLQTFIKECQALSVGVSVEQIEKMPEAEDDEITTIKKPKG
jgi:hypothetical protein